MRKLDIYKDIKQGERGAWVSIGAYLFLSAVKLAGGFWFASEALVADGVNNLTDIVASVAVLIGLRISRKPPDRDHPYGHLRAETIAALIASFIMALAGIQVLIQSVQSLWSGDRGVPDLLSFWLSLFCAGFMYGVYRYNRRLAYKINNQALLAAAQDNRSDALVSLGAAAGILGAQFGLPWLDPIAALAVGIIICRTAWEIFRDATHALTDGFDESKLEAMRVTIKRIKGVQEIKDIKARVHGSNVLVDVVVLVDPQLSLIQSHQICDEIERKMMQKHNIMNIHVHVEPHTRDHRQ